MATAERHRDAAESWFLARGLPAVLRVRARWHHVWPRSAPALTAYATMVSALLVVYFLIGTSEVYIDGAPTPVERIALTVIALAVPLGALLGWLVSRVRSLAQSVIAMVAVVVSIVARRGAELGDAADRNPARRHGCPLRSRAARRAAERGGLL